MFKKLFRNVNKYRVSKFEACYRGYFCLQYSAIYIFAQACNMQVCVHTITWLCLCFYMYILPLIKITFCQILFNVICKAFSLVQVKVGAWQNRFPMAVHGEAWQFVFIDKVVYFTFEQTLKNWAIHYALLEKELLQQNMFVK